MPAFFFTMDRGMKASFIKASMEKLIELGQMEIRTTTYFLMPLDQHIFLGIAPLFSLQLYAFYHALKLDAR